MPLNSETSFETAFANLALASLQDRSPGLLQYLIGFQVMDSNDEKTQGVGIFGCKIGKELVYLPLFFTNGELKGTELMYLKNQDIFCPNNEAWVTYITNRKPSKFGEPSQKTKKDLAGSGIDFFPFRASPERFGKTSTITVDLGRFQQDIPVYGSNEVSKKFAAELISRCNSDIRDSKVSEKTASAMCEAKSYTRALCSELLKNAKLSNQFLSVQGPEKFAAILKKVADDKAEANKGPNQEIDDSMKVTILSAKDKDSWQAFDLDEAGKKKLLKGEIVIKDHRDNTSKVYPAAVPVTINSPAPTTGVYDVLLEDGEMLECWLLNSPEGDTYYSGPCCASTIGNNKVQTSVVVISKKGTCVCKGSEVFARPKSIDPLRDNIGDLSDIGSMSEGNVYAVVNSRGGSIAPFYVVSKFEHDDGRVTFRVINDLDPSDSVINDIERQTQIIVTQGEFGRIRRLGPATFAVPETAKVIPVKVEKEKTDEHGYKIRTHGYGGFQYWRESSRPANIGQIEQLLLRTGKVLPLKLYSSGTEYQVKTSAVVGKLASYTEALKDLIYTHGVNGTDAEKLLKAGNARYKIVYASGYPRLSKQADNGLIQSAPGAPAWNTPPMSNDPYLGIPMGGDQRNEQRIQAMSASNTDPEVYNPDPKLDKSIMDMINQAAQTGQKEVLDTAMLGGLLKTTDSNGMVDKYISDLILGMDRVGRILFLFLKYHEKFEDRYGTEDMVELEDSLRNTFKSLGDLVMFLKQKGAEKSPGEDRTEVKLT